LQLAVVVKICERLGFCNMDPMICYRVSELGSDNDISRWSFQPCTASERSASFSSFFAERWSAVAV